MATTPMVFSSTRGDRAGGLEVEDLALHRDRARLDIPVAAELLPADLDVGAHHQVGLADVQVAAGVADLLLPAPLERHPGEHAGLAGAGGRTAGRVVRGRGVPQVGEDRHAAPLDLGGLRVLVLVDHVLVGALLHQGERLRLHPGRDEGGEVEPGAAVQQQLVLDQLVGDVGGHRIVVQRDLRQRDLVTDGRIGQADQRVRVGDAERLGRAGVQGHGVSITQTRNGCFILSR